MGLRLCPDRLRVALALLVALTLILPVAHTGALLPLGLLALAGVVGFLAYRGEAQREAATLAAEPPVRGHGAALAALIVCGSLLVALPVAAAASGSRDLGLADSFYRSGALIFGGGHVMLPLLHAEVVPPGLVDDDTFLAGYGAAQAIPGPLSTFAAFLGTTIGLEAGERAPWLTGVLCTVAIFLPSWLLVAGALPFWRSLRRRIAVRAALYGTNAGVVGLLLAALVHAVASEAFSTAVDVAIVAAAFALLQWMRAPSWSIVLACALAASVSG
jgi:chromate transporter